MTRFVSGSAHLIAAAAVLLLAAAAAAEEAYVVEMSSYVLRSAPRSGAPSVGRVQVGERVFVIDRDAGWAQVEIGDRKGWLPETGVGTNAPAVNSLGPMQERIAGLEARVAESEGEKTALREENSRLGARISELEQTVQHSSGAVAAAKSSVRFREMALGGGLVILGWLAGYGFAAARRSRRGATRYEIG